MTGRKWALAGLLAVICLFLILKMMSATGWGRTVPFPVERAVREITAPLQRGVYSLMKGTSDFLAYFTDNKLLRQQNEEITKRMNQMENEIYNLKDQELENQRLKQLLEYRETRTANYTLKMAAVIGRDPSNWYETIIINQGEKQGVKPNMAVVTHAGLVGRVVSVTASTAEVLLILDKDGAVGGRIFENRLAQPGVVVGSEKTGLLQMIHISHDVIIEAGQTIVTSGLGGIYPKGIRIGSVLEVQQEPNGLMKNALIQPFVDFSRLEEVFVILQVISPEADLVPEPAVPETTTEKKG